MAQPLIYLLHNSRDWSKIMAVLDREHHRIASDDDLPPPCTRRWVVRRKAAVVTAVQRGKITLTEVCARYGLSEEEFKLWESAMAANGTPGLRVTRIQIYKM